MTKIYDFQPIKIRADKLREITLEELLDLFIEHPSTISVLKDDTELIYVKSDTTEIPVNITITVRAGSTDSPKSRIAQDNKSESTIVNKFLKYFSSSLSLKRRS
jgi:hypothetical protein